MRRRAALLVLAGVVASAIGAHAAPAPARIDMPLRGRTMALTIYRPDGAAKGTVIMGSGDVGWVGLAVSRAQELAAAGYLVAGVNVREYLSAFTTKTAHLEPADIQHDFGTLAVYLRQQGWLAAPVLLSGVSEGAGIVVVAAASVENHAWLDGVITMGLPRVSEVAWRWSDFTSWITKKDASEPSVDALAFLPGIAPVPVVMLQSKKDEYVPEADYRQMEAAAAEPKRLVLIDASNHRFTDRIPELRRAYDDALAWVRTKPVR
ncbi:MAG: AcvB/VirJ family lysyl-phosphatidylglycerol hydrolase [Vicinamibacterales bacterium]